MKRVKEFWNRTQQLFLSLWYSCTILFRWRKAALFETRLKYLLEEGIFKTEKPYSDLKGRIQKELSKRFPKKVDVKCIIRPLPPTNEVSIIDVFLNKSILVRYYKSTGSIDISVLTDFSAPSSNRVLFPSSRLLISFSDTLNEKKVQKRVCDLLGELNKFLPRSSSGARYEKIHEDIDQLEFNS